MAPSSQELKPPANPARFSGGYRAVGDGREALRQQLDKGRHGGHGVVAGDRDAEFLIIATDERPEGQLVAVRGWNCNVQPL